MDYERHRYVWPGQLALLLKGKRRRNEAPPDSDDIVFFFPSALTKQTLNTSVFVFVCSLYLQAVFRNQSSNPVSYSQGLSYVQCLQAQCVHVNFNGKKNTQLTLLAGGLQSWWCQHPQLGGTRRQDWRVQAEVVSIPVLHREQAWCRVSRRNQPLPPLCLIRLPMGTSRAHCALFERPGRHYSFHIRPLAYGGEGLAFCHERGG